MIYFEIDGYPYTAKVSHQQGPGELKFAGPSGEYLWVTQPTPDATRDDATKAVESALSAAEQYDVAGIVDAIHEVTTHWWHSMEQTDIEQVTLDETYEAFRR